jgi:hypothetical protein
MIEPGRNGIIPRVKVGHNNLDGSNFEIGTGREVVKRRVNGRDIYVYKWSNNSY